MGRFFCFFSWNVSEVITSLLSCFTLTLISSHKPAKVGGFAASKKPVEWTGPTQQPHSVASRAYGAKNPSLQFKLGKPKALIGSQGYSRAPLRVFALCTWAEGQRTCRAERFCKISVLQDLEKGSWRLRAAVNVTHVVLGCVYWFYKWSVS